MKSIKYSTSIALLGQPNAGKSTLFNVLTGSNQHVGNWPGKTVEQKTGSFTYKEKNYHITDLPGSYSLSANSAEEIITRDFITSKQADLVCILADASQLERSLFMLSDYIGIKCPAILIINMIDIAEKQGKKINEKILEERLGIPVIKMSASNKKDYQKFYEALEKPYKIPKSRHLTDIYKDTFKTTFDNIYNKINTTVDNRFSTEWIVAKILENDTDIIAKTNYNNTNDETSNLIKSGNCKFTWIKDLLQGAVEKKTKDRFKMNRFDRIATNSTWGKITAVLILLSGLLLSFAITIPWMMFSFYLPRTIFPFINTALIDIHAAGWLISLIETLFNACGTSIGMIGFIAGSAFVFGLMEDIGYMARVSYVFDDLMSKLHLHGKSIMSFMMSFGCSIGGSLSARIIDSWGQRVLTIALAWLVPCAATWGVISVFGTAFFGINTIWIMLSLFICSFGIMYLAVKIFAPKLVKKDKRYGLIMELPPYHSPKWGSIFHFVFRRMGAFAKRAFTFILSVTAIFWFLAYTSDGNIENSIIYKFGEIIEPVTMWFGLRWQTFVAFICSMMGKEASLGVLSSVFGASSHVIGKGEVLSDLAPLMSSIITKPEALAFIFAFYFNIPCFVAVLSAKEESHSWSWTLRIIAFYIIIALIMATAAYHIGMFIF